MKKVIYRGKVDLSGNSSSGELYFSDYLQGMSGIKFDVFNRETIDNLPAPSEELDCFQTYEVLETKGFYHINQEVALYFEGKGTLKPLKYNHMRIELGGNEEALSRVEKTIMGGLGLK